MNKITLLIGFLATTYFTAIAQMPKPACVGYWQNWSNNVKLPAINNNYNVIQLAFATTVGSSMSNMTFALPGGYTKTQFLTDIDGLHTKGKVVILSIGGANDPVRLDNTTARDEFVTSINAILASYNYKIDGIDLDFESSSMAFGSTWTMTAPAAAQTNMIDAVKSIMANYKTQTGKKMLLTMAPETIYLMGALSSYQVTNTNGGAMLPIIEGLSAELDLLHCQYYNAGGTGGGTVAIDGKTYFDNSDPDYITAMTESIIKGFTLLKNKGVYKGLPASKVAFGLPASNNACDPGTGTGYNTPADVCLAAKYVRGVIAKPAGWSYTMTAKYPDLGGMMAWSINEDFDNTCNGSYSFANNFTCAFDATTTDLNEQAVDASQTSFYPSPVTDVLHVNNVDSEARVSIYNIIGKEVLSAYLTDNSINLSGLTPGVYVVELKSNAGTVREKVIKK